MKTLEMKNLGDNLLPSGGEVYYIPNVFSHELAEQYFRLLLDGIRWKQEPVRIFGREILQPRLTSWYGDAGKSYTYSGLTMKANQWMYPLQEIKSIADEIAGAASTSALLNLYRNGNDGLGWHRDNEKMLGPAPVIASVSLGEPRTFQMRNYQDKKQVISMELEPGSLLIMKGASQKEWEHRVPKTKKTRRPRINITFRTIGD